MVVCCQMDNAEKPYAVKHFCSLLRKVLIVQSNIISCLIMKYFYYDSN